MSPKIATNSSLKIELNITQYGILSRPNQDLRLGWDIVFSLVVRMVLYVSILVVLVIVVALIFKYLGQCGNDEIVERTTTTETSHLMPTKAITFTYGTYDPEEDLESGKRSRNSSDELYDGKICIICYDEQRNCFFVPCGHCATCHVCAQRIIDEDSKACPVCRRFIHRVKKLFTPQNQNVADFSRQKKIVSFE
ncbi:hypothetical protein RHSIM_Rhsim08G0096900 [Rhododendron simsii]|uniref:RING-type domain-containing protein n=1 Tax=Rhododendron simsii TaxID=118357 RepID=A0A834LDQ0_RHOSS|nr:hypothetical protein RHSIM_Rhsim08G0096900 [Rhododendron simsii]